MKFTYDECEVIIDSLEKEEDKGCWCDDCGTEEQLDKLLDLIKKMKEYQQGLV